MLDIDKSGKISESDRAGVSLDSWLDNTLIGTLYPNIKIALVTVPCDPLEFWEASAIRNCMVALLHNGVQYRMIGASGSAKNGRFYFADVDHAPVIKERFQRWPEAAFVYLGIQTSQCKVMIDLPNIGVLVVPDNDLGTNDCRGWISRRVFEQMQLAARGTREDVFPYANTKTFTLPADCIYQSRIAFGNVQAKGLCKIMENDVADVLGADVILPKSSVKPGLTGSERRLESDRPELKAQKGNWRFVEGRTVIGFREFSHPLKFESSYQVLQHAPEKVIMTEVVPQARQLIQELTDAWHVGNHLKVVEMIGKKVPFGEEHQEKHEEEYQAVEAALLADGSGEITRHPYIQKNVKRLIARWGYKMCTGGGLQIPAFTLADDGWLILKSGRIVSGSDWLPMDIAIVTAPIESARGLCLRYPVRMAEDLLPMQHANASQVAALLVEHGLTQDEAKFVAEKQLCLAGTYSLHSKTAKRNGGDFDGDMVGVVDSARYPMFVDYRFQLTEHPAIEKTKVERARSGWYNIEFIAMDGLGNKIGQITNLISASIANGRHELIHEPLCPQLQLELDSLKHNTKADSSVLEGVREQLKMPAWLGLKDPESLENLPENLDVLPTDFIGQCYNKLRPLISDMMGTPMALSQFAGLIVGGNPTQAMYDECRFMMGVFREGHALIRGALDRKHDEYKAATDKLDVAFKSKDKKAIAALRKEQRKAWSALDVAKKANREQSSALHKIVAGWAASKTTDRKSWCQALSDRVCRTTDKRSTGAIIWHTFPQEMIDSIAERTDGIRTTVAPKKMRGSVTVEGNGLYLHGLGRSYIFSYDPEKSQIFHETTQTTQQQ